MAYGIFGGMHAIAWMLRE